MPNKRDLILRATEKIIASSGIQGLSMQQVANEAGVAAGTIYRYFKDKNELILELRKDVLAHVAAFILEDHQLGTLEQRFKRIWLKMHSFGKQRTPTNLSYEQYAHLPEINNEEIRNIEITLFAPLKQLFDEGKAAGIMQPLHPRALYALSMEPAMAIARTTRRGQIQYEAHEIELACDLCWKTILIPIKPTH
ncbi:TetR/AcrR family transcriptional regulator [Shewanella sp. GutDb-MelDb]|uniref:TetR/AcrR family transcriptional regulator n=1 Tax=Shewanella sp. GutDb-MelDb TaxID=2058316 RepID=UPI0015E102F6|nr:TetR/AcrR family transcriptional regulator [Shewanella sp. GutDb-MelDb]